MPASHRNDPSFRSVIAAISHPGATIQVLGPAISFPQGSRAGYRALVPPGSHSYFELVVCCAGRMNIVGYSSTYQLKRGDALLVKPGAWHYESYSRGRRSYEAFWLSAAPRLMPYTFSRYVRGAFQIAGSGAWPRVEEVDNLGLIVREVEEKALHWQAKARSLLMELLVNFDRHKSGNGPDLIKRKLDPAQRLLRIVNARYREDLRIKSLAEEVGMSADHLSRRFRSLYGATFKDHLVTIRIHHARDLLKSGWSIKETAEECGFSDVYYFGRVFKARCKTTPGSFLRELRSFQT